MTPEEKAKQLVDKFQKEIPDYLYQGKMLDIAAKACALICVDEILDFMEADDKKHDVCSWLNSNEFRYYESVKEEINKI